MNSFGYKVQTARKKRGWTVRTFVERLGLALSSAYITKIEVHGEIPAPAVTCKIAEVLGIDEAELLEIAKEGKRRNFDEVLEKKYQQAIGLYRLQKR
jgi:transcriptional regulator with XRE-family HTH domain